MADNVSGGLPGRGQFFLTGNGKTLSDGDCAFIEGTIKTFVDKAPRTGSGATTRRTNGEVTCILVQNVSGIALDPKRPVKWAAGYRNRRVDGYCHVDSEECAGVVDEHYKSSGVPDNEYFWLVIKGPCLLKTSLAGSAENVIAEGDKLIALTAATSQATTAGRVVAWDLTATSQQTTNGTQSKRMLFHLGTALSAKTTGNTNADLLVDLEIMK